MANCRGHAPDLAIFPFDQFEPEPTGGHRFAHADGWDARRQLRLRFEYPRAAGEGFASLYDQSLTEIAQGFGSGNSLNLGPIFAIVRPLWMEQSLVQFGFIA